MQISLLLFSAFLRLCAIHVLGYACPATLHSLSCFALLLLLLRFITLALPTDISSGSAKDAGCVQTRAEGGHREASCCVSGYKWAVQLFCVL